MSDRLLLSSAYAVATAGCALVTFSATSAGDGAFTLIGIAGACVSLAGWRWSLEKFAPKPVVKPDSSDKEILARDPIAREIAGKIVKAKASKKRFRHYEAALRDRRNELLRRAVAPVSRHPMWEGGV
jgi:hypothetical protein